MRLQQTAKADELERLGRRPAALFGRAGEGDRHVPDMKPKWVGRPRIFDRFRVPRLINPRSASYSSTVERGRTERTTDDRLLCLVFSSTVLSSYMYSELYEYDHICGLERVTGVCDLTTADLVAFIFAFHLVLGVVRCDQT